MDSIQLTPTSTVALGLGAIVILNVLIHSFRPSHFPPGPTPLPIIGNLHQIPTKDIQITCTEWNRKYGDVLGFRIFNLPVIILGSHRAAREILDRRAAMSSGRPRSVMVEDICQIGKFTSLCGDMELHRHHRRMFAKALSSRAMPTYWPIQLHEMQRAVLEIVESDNEAAWRVSIQRAIESIISQVVYDYKADTVDDPWIAKVTRILRGVEIAAKPGEYAVEGFPFLKYVPSWFPGAGFKRTGLRIRQECRDMVDEPYDNVKRKLIDGQAAPCFVANLIQDDNGQIIADSEEEERIKWAAGILHLAGVDTTVSAIEMFLVATLQFPAAQQKAQAEMDRVVGKDRLPTMEDREQLPFCAAMVQETLRWKPVIPLSLPHVLSQDELYEGYVLPKGSLVVANSWGLARDPTAYPDPETFDPARFVTEDGKVITGGEDGREAFGWGRRVCSGQHLAEAALFAFVISFVWAANISGSTEYDGSEVACDTRVVCRPSSIPAVIQPRTSTALEMLRTVVTEET